MKKQQFIQYLSDKIKEAKEKGFAWLSYHDERIKIVPIDKWYEEELGTGYYEHHTALIKSRKRKIAMVDLHNKDARPNWKSGSHIVNDNRRLAIVVERYKKNDRKENLQ